MKQPPMLKRFSALGWVTKNLLSPWTNFLATCFCVMVIWLTVPPIVKWALTVAKWDVIPANFSLLMKGMYPEESLWRLHLCLYWTFALSGVGWYLLNAQTKRTVSVWLSVLPALFLTLTLTGIGIYPHILGYWGAQIGALTYSRRSKRDLSRAFPILFLLTVPTCLVIVLGLGRWEVPTHLWGGFLLTILLASSGILFSLPLGILLALGRRSKRPIFHSLSVCYIELIRGVPLVTILFMMQVLFPLFLPHGITIDRVIRALIGLTLFTAAYVAEIIRGGLQMIPRGQSEASWALGFSPNQSLRYIILPQALRSTIPILVSQSLSLLKDTTLVAVVGLLDLLGIAQSVLSNPDFMGLHKEVYLVIAVVFWLCCALLARLGHQIETALKQQPRVST